MAVEDNSPPEIDEEAECSCGEQHDEIPEDIRAILAGREGVRTSPENFQHEQVPFLDFKVDAELEQLITNLWIMDMPVHFSCQGYAGLCHFNLNNNREFHTELNFMRVSDGIQFLKIFTELFGSGEAFDGNGIMLLNRDGDLSDLDAEELGPEKYVQEMHRRTRAGVTFNPQFVQLFSDSLDHYISGTPALEDRRSMLEVAEDADDAYSILEVDDFIREQTEGICNC